ncbi:MAG: alpha-ketoglutarate-dependent dioxygenase AlkB [Microbacteriaceae bacterium]|jgi:alkylated DNA repair dioxygenase AlkB|nr:alpha-ketoglutarate-dependent dioxygenase AlkB [Microbacteriaceae bacterium]
MPITTFEHPFYNRIMTIAFQPSLLDSFDERPALAPLAGTVRRIPLADGAWVDLRPGWLADSDAVFETLVTVVPWRADRRQMYDRVVDVPRLVSHFGPGATLPHPVLTDAMTELNTYYSPAADQRFQTAGLCFYRTGDDSVAWHGDRVGRTIDRDTMVGILSVGEPRVLSVRRKTGGDVLRFPLGHGDLIVMGGSCQRTHEHAILKTKKAVGPRISVQFRPVWPT